MLQKLQFRPGVNREGTTLTNEGGFYGGDKIRFRSGQVEKIGGWTLDTGTVNTGGQYIGVCRSLKNWVGLNNYNYLGLGTNAKFYIQLGTGGYMYDVTPFRAISSAGAATFAASNGSSSILVTQTAHGAATGDYVIFTNAASLGGNVTAAILNQTQGYVITYNNANSYYITVSVVANSSDSGNGGASTIAKYQLAVGAAVFGAYNGWGAGGWGGLTVNFPSTGWGQSTVNQQLRLWSQSPFGQNLLMNPRGGAIYYWVVDSSNPNTVNVAQILSKTNTNTQNGTQYWLTDASCPTLCNYVIVSDASRFVIAFGTDTYGDGVQNPMLISWSDQESVTTWTPSITNQAGNFVLSRGSQIITAVQTRQEIVVLTDVAIYSMQYVGAPYVWSFNILGDNISIIGPNAAASVNNVVYWMGQDKFFMYSGQVQTLPCTLREYVFQNINKQQSYQFFAGINEGYNEIWWFYCSANSNVIDKYVIYNHLEQIWYYGNLTRSAWADTPLRNYPTAAGYNLVTSLTTAMTSTSTTANVISTSGFPTSGFLIIGAEIVSYSGITSTSFTGLSRAQKGTIATLHVNGASVAGTSSVSSGIVYHESGIDDGTTVPPSAITSYIQSSDFDIGDGYNFGFVWRIIPDVSFNGSTNSAPQVTFTMLPRQNPGSNYGSTDLAPVVSGQSYVNQSTYDVQQFTQYAFCRLRGRQMAFVVYSNTTGVQWQLGTPRLDVRPDGRR